MPLKFFTIPIQASESAESELNAFLRSHKVLAVDRRWVDQGAASFWSLCVDYLDSRSSDQRGAGSSQSNDRSRVDYREKLSSEDFAVFAKLRQWRKETAQAEAVPVYTIFTNEQLANMVQSRAVTKTALEKITGVGDARIEKYGPRVLEFLAQQWKNGDEASGKPV